MYMKLTDIIDGNECETNRKIQIFVIILNIVVFITTLIMIFTYYGLSLSAPITTGSPAEVSMSAAPHSEPMAKSFTADMYDAEKVELLVFDQQSDEYLGKKTLNYNSDSLTIDEYDTSYYVVARSVGINKVHTSSKFNVNNYREDFKSSGLYVERDINRLTVDVIISGDDTVKILVFNTETENYTQEKTLENNGEMTIHPNENEMVFVKSVKGDKSVIRKAYSG